MLLGKQGGKRRQGEEGGEKHPSTSETMPYSFEENLQGGKGSIREKGEKAVLKGKSP